MTVQEKTNEQQTKEVTSLAKYAGVLVAFLALLFGVVQWFDARYVDQRVFTLYQDTVIQERNRNEERLADIFESIERERERDLVMLHRAIRDASMSGLIIRRDILLSRGRHTLSPEEKTELDILETKLKDIITRD